MNQATMNLAALIGSRICHDLISPIGAINNGLELLTMSREANNPEMGLIGESVSNASARIRFFRIAFGASADHEIAPAEITSILHDLYQGGRMMIHWTPEGPQPRVCVRLCFLALLCLETALPYGGHVHLREDNDDWSVHAQGDRLTIDAALWSHLAQSSAKEQPTTEILPAHVQFAMLPLVATSEGRKLKISLKERDAKICF
ncbi:MAG: histidine phosphotransferase family protein [Pseudomonadota bacterium]